MSDTEEQDPYHGLQKLDPSEWLNIPRPIITTLVSLKDLIIDHTNQLKDLSSSVFSQQANIQEEVNRVNKEVTYIKTTFTKYQEDSMIMMENLNTSVTSDMNKFKSNLLTDLDYKQKNVDSKIGYLEEQIFHTRKFTSSMPTMIDIVNRINDTISDMKEKLKKDIKENMIIPEVRSLNYDIKDHVQNLKNIISDTEERIKEKVKEVSSSLNATNENIDAINKKFSSFQMKFSELSEFSDENLNKIQGLNILLDDFDKNNKAGLKKVESKFNIVFSSISDIQNNSNSLKKMISDLEHEISSNKDLIFQVESSLTENLKSLIEESKKNIKDIKEKKSSKGSKDLKDSLPEISQVSKRKNSMAASKVTESMMNDFKLELSGIKEKLFSAAQESEEKLKSEIQRNINEFTEIVRVIKKENDESFKEIQSKLTWLPVNVTDLSNMNAYEARLFTLEARLRSEENSRIKGFNFLGKMIESVKYSKDILANDRGKTRDTPEGIYTIEILKKLEENDRKTEKYREVFAHTLDTGRDEHQEIIRKNYRTPKSRDFANEPVKESRTSSVMGRRVLRQTLN